MNWGSLDKYAKSLIKEAGHRIRVSFYSTIDVDTKSDADDLVTNIDKEVEQFFIKRIRTDFPNHRIMGEEGFGDEVTSLEGVVWFIDPIDGTMNFVHQRRNFAISVGIYIDGIGMLGYIYDVMRDDFYYAMKDEGAYFNDERLPSLEPTQLEESIIGMNARWVAPNSHVEHVPVIDLIRRVRGTRSYGSAALELAYVASGRLDAYLSMRLAPWDIAGGIIIAREVGAIATTMKNKPLSLLQTETFIVANQHIHNKIIQEHLQCKN